MAFILRADQGSPGPVATNGKSAQGTESALFGPGLGVLGALPAISG